MPRLVDLTGQQYGRLTVIERAERSGNGKVQWLCRCACGADTVARADKLTLGRAVSCGCAETAVTLIHGQSRTALYHRWKGLVERTTNPRHDSYPRYGGRGIAVCARWRAPAGQGFQNFAADMGEDFRSDLTIERLDVNGPYSPENCVWATVTEQQRNRRNARLLTLRGHTKTLSEWCEVLGLPRSRVRNRLERLGWSVERALTTGAKAEALALGTPAP